MARPRGQTTFFKGIYEFEDPSGGLIACGHPVGATGLMQAVFAIWQLQNTVGKHFKDDTLQLKDAHKGAIHSHAGTGTYVTVSILEREA